MTDLSLVFMRFISYILSDHADFFSGNRRVFESL